MQTFKFGLELAGVFLGAIFALFVIYYKLCERSLQKKLKEKEAKGQA